MSWIAFGWFAMAARSQSAAAALERIGREEVSQQKIPGLVLIVVKGDRVEFAHGFGVANVETNEPLTADHLFRVGSTTKMVTAAALVRLADQGKLNLEAPIGQFLSELSGPLAKLTAHQLLTHTSGLMDRTLMFGRHDDQALADNVRSLQPDVLFTEPGAVFSYSNLGYAIAGRLVEALTGKPFADAVAELVLEPAGMKRTTFRPTIAMTYPLAQGHVRSGSSTSIGRPAADHSGYWPAGSMFTSGNDFARFTATLLNEGRLDGKQSIPATVIEKLRTRHVATSAVGGYGYGLGVHEAGGHKVLSHGGARSGYSTHLIAVPYEKLAVIALINVSGGNAARPAERAFQAVAGWSPRPPLQTIPTNIKPEQIVGTYSQYTRIVVIKRKEGVLTLSTGGEDTTLTPGNGNCNVGGPTPTCFQLGADGRVTYLLSGSRAHARRD